MTNDFYQCRTQEWIYWYTPLFPNFWTVLNFKVLTSTVYRLASRIQRPESRVQSPGSWVQCPVSIFQHPEFSVQGPASSVQSPDSSVQCPECSVQSSVSRVQRPEPRVQRPALASRAQEFRSPIFVLCSTYGIRILLFWEILWHKPLRERAF